MSRSLCKGPFFLFIPLLIGVVMTYLVALALRPVLGVLAWYWFVALFALCFALSMFIVGALDYVVTRPCASHEYDGNLKDCDRSTKQPK